MSTESEETTRNDRLKRFAHDLPHYYPFTLSGTVVFLVCFVLFGLSISAKNAYGVVISFLGLFAIAVLVALGRLQAQRLHRSQVSWEVSTPLFARVRDQAQELSIDGPDPFLFFRVHVRLRGRFRIANRTSLSLFRDVASDSARDIRLPLVFPFCGTIRARGLFYVGDLFGLTRSRFGEPRQFALTIQPAPLVGSEVPPVQATGGDRETSKTKQPDEERYYMREYVPGDRFRDINWKASSRLSELYTRTSPVTQEQTQIVSVYFRHFVPVEHTRESIERIAHLNYVKSWLIAYLWTVKQEHPDFQFRILTGRGEALVESELDIEALSRSIADLFMEVEPPYYGSESPGTTDATGASGNRERQRDSTVFSTAFDDALMGFMQARLSGGVSVYRTAKETPDDRAALRPAPSSKGDEHSISNLVRYGATNPGFFPVISSFIPIGLPVLRDKNRTTPPVASGGDVQLSERTLVVDL